jgi:hypothetical protein
MTRQHHGRYSAKVIAGLTCCRRESIVFLAVVAGMEQPRAIARQEVSCTVLPALLVPV